MTAEDRRGKLLFEQIAVGYGPMIRRIAATYEADRSMAEELVQEILFALWRALPSFRGQGSERAFVARVATNLSVTHVRRALRLKSGGEVSEDLVAPGNSPEAEVVAHDEQARLLTEVRALPLVYRQAVLLTLEGLTVEEVANALGISANAVAIRMTRAKELLRARLVRP